MIQELAQLKTQIQKDRNEVSEASCKIFYFIDSYWKYFFFRKEHIYVFKSERKSESSGKEYDLLLGGGISNGQNTQLGR